MVPFFRYPAPTMEGRFAVVTNVERGMRWTPWLRKTSAGGADGEIVWSRSPDAGIKSCGTFRRATVARKPGAPRRARISRKTIAQGVPAVPAALTLLACAKCISFARKARGCGQHPAFPAPSRLRVT